MPSQTIVTLTDSEIISRVVSRETNLYEVLIRRYNGYLYKVGMSYGFDHFDTQDLMQETHVNAYMNLMQFENRSSFKTWIVRIMLNQCYHKRQKASVKKEIFLETKFGDNVAAFIEDTDKNGNKTVQNNELKKVLEDAIHDIPEEYRMVFTLRELNGMSVRETSETMNISESNVKVRFYRAKAMLQDKIKKTYSQEEIFEFNLIYCDKMVDRVMCAKGKIYV